MSCMGQAFDIHACTVCHPYCVTLTGQQRAMGCGASTSSTAAQRRFLGQCPHPTAQRMCVVPWLCQHTWTQPACQPPASATSRPSPRLQLRLHQTSAAPRPPAQQRGCRRPETSRPQQTRAAVRMPCMQQGARRNADNSGEFMPHAPGCRAPSSAAAAVAVWVCECHAVVHSTGRVSRPSDLQAVKSVSSSSTN